MAKNAVEHPVASPATESAASRTRGERGTGTSISIDLKEHPELLARIRKAAAEDDREASKFLRRLIVKHADTLLG